MLLYMSNPNSVENSQDSDGVWVANKTQLDKK